MKLTFDSVGPIPGLGYRPAFVSFGWRCRATEPGSREARRCAIVFIFLHLFFPFFPFGDLEHGDKTCTNIMMLHYWASFNHAEA